MSVMSHEIRNFAFVMDAVVKILLLLLLLCSSPLSGLAAGDSTLVDRVAALGTLLQREEYEEAFAKANKLLPEAMEQQDVMAQGGLRVILGSCRMHWGQYQQAMREYTICADLSEKADFLHIARNNEPRNHIMFNLYIPMYSELVALNQQMGNKVEALYYARIALRWLSICNDRRLRATMMPHIALPLIENKEYRLVYPLLQQSFINATDQDYYDCALMLCTELIECEDNEFLHRPDEYEWIKAGDMLLSLATQENVKSYYIKTRDAVLGKSYDAAQNDGTQLSRHDTTAKAILDMEHSVTTAVSGDSALSVSPDATKTDPDSASLEDVSSASPHSDGGHAGIVLILILVLITCISLFVAWHYYRRKQREATRKLMDERYIEGQENERTRLAKELHDSVANQLLAVEMKLSTDGLTPQAMELLNESREQVRHVSHELLPPEFTHHTIDEILTQYAAQIDGVRKCTVTYTSTPDNADWSFIPKQEAMEIYRIVQEAVSNALKHSEASMVSIGLHLDEKRNLMMIVSDNGIGQDSKDETTDGIGIRTIRQRAEAIGGRIEFYRHQYGNVVKLVVKK